MYQSGLVLEGGGMRGIFTAGVLDFFLEKQVEFAEIIAVSAGACHACSYVSKQHGRAKAVSIDYLDDKRYCSLYSLLTTGDLFSAQFVYGEIPDQLNPFDHETYMQSKTKLLAAVTNVHTGKAEYLPLRDLHQDIEIVRASASLPMVSKMVTIDGKQYLDGGMSDSIPIRKMQEEGYNKSVVILTQPKGYQKEASKSQRLVKHKYRRYPKLIAAMENRHRHYNETLAYIDQQEQEGKVLVIRPQEKLIIDRIEKDKAKLESVYQIGYKQGQEQYQQLITFLEEK